jgi:hypothetical protein
VKVTGGEVPVQSLKDHAVYYVDKIRKFVTIVLQF